MEAASDTVAISSGSLRVFAAALLSAGGFTPDQAEQTAAMLVWANLRGANSHGVLRIPRYVEMVEAWALSIPPANLGRSRAKARWR